MINILQQFINGCSLGSIYALMALGYTMVYGIIKLINFAHGDVFMIGAFLGYFFVQSLGMGFIPAIICSMIICAILGMLIEFFAYRRLRDSSRITVLITAIGVSFLLQYLMIYFFGASVRPFPQVINIKQFEFWGIEISNIEIYIILMTVMLMLLLQFVIQKTKMGKAMRAVSVDADAAKLMGINVNRTISFTFAIGSALAAAGGVLIGIYYNTINPLMGMTPGIKAFIAAVLGGIGVIPGAFFGGFAIGLLETFVSALGFSGYKEAFVYGILILILLVKPAGLLGKNTKEKV